MHEYSCHHGMHVWIIWIFISTEPKLHLSGHRSWHRRGRSLTDAANQRVYLALHSVDWSLQTSTVSSINSVNWTVPHGVRESKLATSNTASGQRPRGKTSAEKEFKDAAYSNSRVKCTVRRSTQTDALIMRNSSRRLQIPKHNTMRSGVSITYCCYFVNGWHATYWSVAMLNIRRQSIQYDLQPSCRQMGSWRLMPTGVNCL